MDVEVSLHRVEDGTTIIAKTVNGRISAIPFYFSGNRSNSVGYYARELKRTLNATKSDGTIMQGYSTINLRNTPKHLMFDSNRIKFMSRSDSTMTAFDDSKLWLDSEIQVNGITYVLSGRIEYNPENNSFLTFVKDQVSSALICYENGRVSRRTDVPLGDFLDSLTLTLLYTQKDSVNVVVIPKIVENAFYEISGITHLSDDTDIDLESEDFDGFLKMTESITDSGIIPKQCTDTGEQLEFALIWHQIYKPDYSKYPQEMVQLQFLPIEHRIKQYISRYSIELVNLRSKFEYGTYQLGQDNYSFSPLNSDLISLQMMLSLMASSSNFVMTLFSTIRGRIEFQLAIVIARMLLGCKNIALNALIKEICLKSKRSIIFFATNTNHDPEALNNQIREINSLIDPSLIANPIIKRIHQS